MKTIMPIFLLFLLLVFLPGSTGRLSAAGIGGDMLEQGYREIESKAAEYRIPFSMTFDEYAEAFYQSGFDSPQEYTDAYLGILEPMDDDGVNGDTKLIVSKSWYYNIGTVLPEDADLNYAKYHLYDTVRKGDIIFEPLGGFGITGHVAIVEGKYYNAARDKEYIRIIETISDGVVRSCLDDNRADDKNAVLLRVEDADAAVIDGAVTFCEGEIGSKYNLDFQKDRSRTETDWYCSELIWAAFYDQGIDIEGKSFNEPGVTPRDIYNSENTGIVDYK